MENKANFYPGCYYHVFNHAIASEDLFKDVDNYEYFLKQFNHHLAHYVDLIGFCLLPNHFHLLIQVKWLVKDEIETHNRVLQSFSNFQNGYSKAINKRHERKGRLVQDTINRKRIHDEDNLKNVAKYIYQNPVKHGFCDHPHKWEYCQMDETLLAA